MRQEIRIVYSLHVERCQTFTNSIFGQFSDAVNMEFLAYLPAMGFDRLHASIKTHGYLLGALAFSNQLKYLSFLRGQNSTGNLLL